MKALVLATLLPMLFMGIGKLAALFQKIYMARHLSVSDYGAINYAIAIVSLAATFCVFGMQKTMLKNIPVYLKNKQSHAFRVDVWGSQCIVVVLSAVLSAFLFLFYTLQLSYIEIDFFVFYLFCIVSSQALLILVSHQILSLGRSGLFVFVSQFLFNFLMLVFLMALDGLSYENVVQIWCFSSLISLVISQVAFVYLANAKGIGVFGGLGFPNREFYKYSFTLLLSTVAYIALTSVDRIMLGVMEGNEAVAEYSVIFTIAVLLPLLLTVFDAVLSPKISAYVADEDKASLGRFYQECNTALVVASSILSILIIIFSDTLLLLFGSSYTHLAKLLFLLVIGEFVNVALGASGRVLQLTSNQSVEAKLVLYAVLVNIFLNVIFISAYGVWGAVLATVFTRLGHTLMKTYYVRKLVGIEVWGERFIFNLMLIISVLALLIWNIIF